MASTATEKAPPGTTLSSDLARLSLPQTSGDATRRLAYANSICALFLVIGIIGLNPPKISTGFVQSADNVPVIFAPPAEAAPEEPQKPDPSEPSDTPNETPEVATIVAPANANVAFAVPVEGPVIVVSSSRFVPAPPANASTRPSSPQATRFSSTAEIGGKFPDPTYPREELSARHEGKLMLYVIVGADGLAESVTVQDSCGFSTLDRHALNWVRRNWRFLPGETRHYLVPIEFRIQ